MSGHDAGKPLVIIMCGWCNKKPATCRMVGERPAPLRGKAWPVYGCDECCGHCRCGDEKCCCVHFQEATYGNESGCVVEARGRAAAFAECAEEAERRAQQLGYTLTFVAYEGRPERTVLVIQAAEMAAWARGQR